MASGEAEPLQYTTTVLRVSIHCEGCKKKVKKVLHSIEGVYKVTVDAAQHKVTVTGNVEADALLRRLHKAGKQAALWPSPAPMAPVPEAKKPEEAAPAAVALAEAAGESSAKDASDAKPKDAEAKEKPPEKGDGKEKKPDKDKNAEKGDAAAKPSMDAKASTEPKETKKGSPETAKLDAAEEASADEPSGGGKKGKKNKKNKPKDGDEGEALTPAAAPAAPEKKPHQPPVPVPSPGPERPPHGAFPYYAQPVLSYNVAHPSSSVSYYAPTHGVPMHPMPPPPPPPPQVVPYGYPPYPAMVPVPAEFLYGPPGMRSSPPQESYNNMFNEDNANLCSLM